MQLELRQLQRSAGITFILIPHDLEGALIMCDRIAVMFNGRSEQLASGLAGYPISNRDSSTLDARRPPVPTNKLRLTQE